MNQLTNQIAVVTGAGRGIGRAIALAFAGAGANVACVSRTAENAEKIAGDVRALGRRAWALAVDVADAAAVTAAADRILTEAGRVDILVNNAGVTRDGLLMRMRDEDWDAVLNTNLKGAFLFTRALVRAFVRQRSGRIINVASEQRVSDFVNVYQQRVNEALANRGGLAAPEDYPTPGEVADRFAVSIEFGPLDTSDLRLQIPPQRLETLKGDIEKRVTAKLGEVSKEVIERFCSLLKVATTQLQKRPDSGRYHASWQQNLKDFLVAAKGLVELQASDELDDLYAEAQRLVDDYDEAELKEDLSTRADAADKAQSIYDKMLAVFGEKS